MTDNVLPKTHTLPEVAAATGIPLRKLREWSWAKPPKFTHVHIGRERYMTDEMVADLIRSLTVTGEHVTKREADLAKTRERQAARQSRSKPPARKAA